MTTSCLFAGKWKISAAFVRNDPIEKASVNTKAICKHVRSQSCFAALKTWCSRFSEGEKVTPVLREMEKKQKRVSSRWRPWERKYNTLARSALTVFPYAPRKLDETERGRVANPQALLTLWSVTASREAGEKKGKSAHSQLLTRTAWRFLWGSVGFFFLFSFSDHHRFTTAHTSRSESCVSASSRWWYARECDHVGPPWDLVVF